MMTKEEHLHEETTILPVQPPNNTVSNVNNHNTQTHLQPNMQISANIETPA